MSIPGGKPLDLTKLADGTVVTIAGTISFEYAEWEGPLVEISGNNLRIQSTGGVLDGNGAQYWDGKGGNGGKTKPKFVRVVTSGSTLDGFSVINQPVHCFSVQATNTHFNNITIDNTAGASQGHNTDGFDISSSDTVSITNSRIIVQDDCVAINSGKNIVVRNCFCGGAPHGYSIGSVGGRSDNTVSNITVAGCTIENALNGLRIKTIANAKEGSVSNVKWSNVQINNAKMGLVIQQDYQNGGSTGNPGGGVPVSNLLATDISGSVTDQQYHVVCASCTNLQVSNVKLSGGTQGTIQGASLEGLTSG
ncbi:hypothetical protein PYCC9005_003081 [Savitreella phatthalungensis]